MADILVVDDEEQVRRILGRILERNRYKITLASNAAEAKKLLGEQPFDLVFCDVIMPGESGIDLARYIATTYPDTAVIMLTAVDDPKIAENAIEVGVYGYIIKPYNINEIIIHARNALRRRELEISNRDYVHDLERIVETRTDDLKRAMKGIVKAMSVTVESRDPYTSGHQHRVGQLSKQIAIEMGLSEKQIQGVHMAASIHDLGKISVPAEILSKPARLSDIEFALIKTHSQVGYDILREIEFPWPIAEMVYQHHEKINGSGYPQGLAGENILLEARIICVADVIEAMASHRPYRPALGIDTALKEITENAGKLYDSIAVKKCEKLFNKKGFAFEL